MWWWIETINKSARLTTLSLWSLFVVFCFTVRRLSTIRTTATTHTHRAIRGTDTHVFVMHTRMFSAPRTRSLAHAFLICIKWEKPFVCIQQYWMLSRLVYVVRMETALCYRIIAYMHNMCELVYGNWGTECVIAYRLAFGEFASRGLRSRLRRINSNSKPTTECHLWLLSNRVINMGTVFTVSKQTFRSLGTVK